MAQVLQNFLLTPEAYNDIGNVEKKRYIQKLKIIRHLYLNSSTTNAGICSTFTLSPPTCMGLLNQLMETEIVEKKGRGESVGGRKPDLYGLRKNTFFVLSIHIERFRIKLAILDNAHTIISEETIPSEISPDVNIVDLLFDSVNNLISSSEIDSSYLLGIGLSMPGLVSSKEGKNFTYFLTGQESESLQAALKKRFNKQVYILNDAKSACLAEFRFGKAKNKSDVLVISMDWGIGLGIIMGGKMYTGTSGFAGEFGHIPLIDNGNLCYCGKRGCLETVASGNALVKLAREGLREGQNSILRTMTKDDLDKLEPQLIIQAANNGDQFAINVLSEIGINLGKGIAILIQIFNPELIILEGKIAEAKKFITTPIQQSINTYCMIQLKERTKISLSDLGPNSSLLGSTIAVVNNVFKNHLSLAKSQSN